MQNVHSILTQNLFFEVSGNFSTNVPFYTGAPGRRVDPRIRRAKPRQSHSPGQHKLLGSASMNLFHPLPSHTFSLHAKIECSIGIDEQPCFRPVISAKARRIIVYPLLDKAVSCSAGLAFVRELHYLHLVSPLAIGLAYAA